jgi:hypothetical protein
MKLDFRNESSRGESPYSAPNFTVQLVEFESSIAAQSATMKPGNGINQDPSVETLGDGGNENADISW